MAYDKVVDSSVLDAGLKAIADAIREKGGTSDNLAFPTAMVDAIKAIEAGGSGFVSGKVTPASEVSDLTITHNLGKQPDFVALWMTHEDSNYYLSNTHTDYSVFALFAIGSEKHETGISFGWSSYPYPMLRSYSSANIYASREPDSLFIYNANETTVSFGRSNSNSKFLPKTYKWVVA